MPAYGTSRRVAAEALKRANSNRRPKTPPKIVDASEPVNLPKDGNPLDYMLAVLRDPKASKERRDRMAIAAAPFVHKRMMDTHYDRPKSKKQKAAEEAARAKEEGSWSGLLAAE